MERNEELKNLLFIFIFIITISFFSITTKNIVETAVNKNKLVMKQEVAKENNIQKDTVADHSPETTEQPKVEEVKEEKEEVKEEVIEQNAKQREQKLIVRDNVTAVIDIPRINLRAEVVEGVDAKTLKVYAGKFEHSVNPGQVGNFSVAAHNNIDTELFRNLHKIKVGEEIRVVTKTNEYRYKVTKKFVVLPTAYEVTDHTDKAEITLITCTQGNKKRLIVKGELI